MTAPVVKGYCPGALRPMMSGDGLVVRVRPFNGRLRRAQADGIATLAAAHGNGLIDLSSRGNIQIRGVREDSHDALIRGLTAMSLVDADAEIESRRNVLVTPFWQTGEETNGFAEDVTVALSSPDAPQLPGKFGFAVDTGRAPVLQNASADIRLERDAGGGLILVADGFDKGKPVASDTVVAEAMALAEWFMTARGEHRRMATLIAAGVALPEGFFVPRQRQVYAPRPGYTPLGAMVGLAFGQLEVKTLASLAKQGGLRMTPWRMLLVESARKLPEIRGLITDADDPLLRVVACTGAPRCAQGLARTRTMARTLAAHVPPGSFLHMSGCAKGCAHPGPAPLTVTATREGFDLIRRGRADDDPDVASLSSEEIIKAI
ncbi:ferredoxin-nitrite reductase [Sulfitobacter sp. THAF37]|uniref:precorrin-3B synthase n=1 Tax=Sulfitobacter sp. THAF37 TaxID=2587855 RepID=UPI001268C9C5|nr:precorrin-3B synthase [Sulfitobacter sp. THAF37]QFT58402.1 ferredoxin-nitrite reductase [Sulfitobacter sp. THAF37]